MRRDLTTRGGTRPFAGNGGLFVCLFPVSIFLHFRKNVALQSRGGRHRVAYGRGWLGGDGACS